MLLPKMLTSRLTASWLKYLVAALFIFVPLYPKFPLFFLSKSSVAVRAEDFIIFFAAIVLFFNYLDKRLIPQKNQLFLPIVTYWLIGGLSLLSAAIITQSISLPLGVLHWLRRIEYMIGYFLVYQAVKNNPDNKRFYLEVCFLVSIGVLFYGLAQIYFSAPIISTMNSEFSKGVALTLQPGVPISSSFAGHYDLAVYLVFILCLIASSIDVKKFNLKSVFFILLFSGQLWLLLQTGSRMAAFAALGSVSLVLFLGKKIKYLILFWLIFSLGVVNSPQLTGRFGNLFKVIELRNISSINLVLASEGQETVSEDLRPIQQDRSTSIRFDAEWPRAVRAFLKNPFLGTGYSSISLATDNDFLRALGETGLLGFFAFLGVLIVIGRKSLLINQNFDLAYLGMFITMVIMAFLLDVFEASKIATLFWMFTGLKFSAKS